jgi:predicted acetyltransferase
LRRVEIRALRQSELEQAWELDHYAFHTSPDRRELFMTWDPARLVGAFEGDRLVSMAGALPFGQFFGGRSVPMGGISSVATAPDRRGEGLALRVLGQVLEATRQRGEAISSLFPATSSLYRRLGWELAGAYVLRQIAPPLLRDLPRPEGGRVRPSGIDELDALEACYSGYARQVNGMLDRGERRWKDAALAWKERRIYVAENDRGEIEGYLVYRQIGGEHADFGGDWQIGVDDMVATTRDASLGLWRLLGSWASMADTITYPCGPEDPLLLLLPEQKTRVLAEVRWMTRVVDAVAAVEARGFSAGIDLEAHLELRDSIFGDNEGRFVLTVSKGRGRLERGGEGRVALGVAAFSSLYTGWASTATLRRAGYLEARDEATCAALDAAFAGPTPWLQDQF